MADGWEDEPRRLLATSARDAPVYMTNVNVGCLPMKPEISTDPMVFLNE